VLHCVIVGIFGAEKGFVDDRKEGWGRKRRLRSYAKKDRKLAVKEGANSFTADLSVSVQSAKSISLLQLRGIREDSGLLIL
jgi:hypothetical protein